MIGALPTALTVCGTPRPIKADFRNVLQIVSAFDDGALSDREKMYICLRRLYADFKDIPFDDYPEAYRQAAEFIACRMHDSKPGPRTMDWAHDEQLIFAAVNKAAGQEIRALPFLHWWSFLGFFQSVDREDTWSFVLMIRQKRAKHKKLERHEQEFYNANRDLCDLGPKISPTQRAYDAVDKLMAEITQGR